jgi:hypothetical protein
MRTVTPLAVAALAIAMIFVAETHSPDSAAAATVASRWVTQIEVGGTRPQGTATLFAYTSGSGALSLRLAGLRPSTTYWVGLYAGTCARLRTRVILLRRVTSTAEGTVTRGLTLNRPLTTRLRGLIPRQLSVAIGSVRRCGTLAPLALSPSSSQSPSPSPSSSPGATPGASPTASPTPTHTAFPTQTPAPTPHDPMPTLPPPY